MSSDNSVTESQNRRANIQNFLLANAHLLQLKKKRNYDALGIKNGEYMHIVPTEMQPGQLITRVLALTNTDAYLNATPAQISSIIPQLRLFLVQGGDKKDIEVHFHGKTTVDMYDRSSRFERRPVTTSMMFRMQSENVAAGLKSFNISINDRYGLRAITGKMQLFFRSPGDLIHGPYRDFIEIIKRGGGAIDPDERRENKIESIRKKIKATEQFLKDRNDKSKNVKSFNSKGPAPPSLKAVLGWATPDGSDAAATKKKDPKSKKFYDFLKKNRVTFILNVSKHTMSFGEQGELTLDIDLNGYVDDTGGASEEADIFRNTYLIKGQTKSGKIFNSKKLKLTNQPLKTRVTGEALFGTNNLKEIKAKLDEFPKSTYFDYLRKYVDKKMRATGNANPPIDPATFKYAVDFDALLAERELATLRLRLAELTAKNDKKKGNKKGTNKDPHGLKKLTQQSRLVNEIYARCQKDLIRIKHKNFFEALEADGKIKTISVNKEDLGFVEATSDGSTYVPKTFSSREGGIGSVTPANSRAVNSKIKARFEAERQGKAEKMKGEENNPFLVGYDKENKTTRESINFVRLGDIIDVAFHNTDLAVANRNSKKGPTFRMIFDSISLPGPDKKEHRYCLADMPIYLNVFNAFFYNKVIRPQIKSMTISDFTEKLLEYIASIVTQALSRSEVVQTYVPNLVPISRPGKIFNLSPGVRYKHFNPKATTAAFVESQIAKAEDHNRMLFVTMRGVEPNSAGDRKRDEELGIYHLIVGAANGPLMKISFSEQNNPYIKSMNVVEGSSQFPIVPQNAEVTLMGCPMFYQSQTVYIDADFALRGSARDLGLGGYYAIGSVEHSFDGTMFTTKLKCIWQSYALAPKPRRKKQRK